MTTRKVVNISAPERYNNPCAIVYLEHANPWQGLHNPPFSPNGLCWFIDPIWGIRAFAKVMMSYHDKGFKTLEQIIYRYAPPEGKIRVPSTVPKLVQHKNDSEAYIARVTSLSGFNRDEEIPLEFESLHKLATAIHIHEAGYRWLKPIQVTEGLSLAGFKPAIQTPSRTLSATNVLGIPNVVGQMLDQINSWTTTAGDVLSQISPLLGKETIDTFMWACIVASFAIVVYARLDDRHNKGR